MLQALNNNPATLGAWDAIHALSYHTYATRLDTIIADTTSLYEQFGKPIWISEIASGADSSIAANMALMEEFVPWAENTSWIERYFWNQAVSPLFVLCQQLLSHLQACCPCLTMKLLQCLTRTAAIATSSPMLHCGTEIHTRSTAMCRLHTKFRSLGY